MEYEAKRGFEDKKYYDSIPVYVTGKYEFPINFKVTPYDRAKKNTSKHLPLDDSKTGKRFLLL